MSFNYVRFDVGCHLHVCHRNTIEKFPDSVLAKCIAPQFDKRKSDSDFIVIDRDGRHFGRILNYMRDPDSLDMTDWTDSELNDLLREADYYCLSDLAEICYSELDRRGEETNNKYSSPHHSGPATFSVPNNEKLFVVYGVTNMRSLLAASKKQTLVISYLNMNKLKISTWIEELVKLCDHDRFNVYCFADRGVDKICSNRKGPVSSRDFIIALYDPNESRFSLCLMMPELEKFRTRRAQYKIKVYKFWLCIQNNTLANHSATSDNNTKSALPQPPSQCVQARKSEDRTNRN